MSRAVSHYRILEKLGGDGIGWTAGTQTQWWMNMTIDDERPFTDDMKRIVAQQKLAFVATVCPDGTPNLSPKGTIAVWDDTHLVLADIRSPGTVANLKVNPRLRSMLSIRSQERVTASRAPPNWSRVAISFRSCSISIALAGLTRRGCDRCRQFGPSFW